MSRRREHVPFDPYHFEKRRRAGASPAMRDTFEAVYRTNHWGASDSVSGEGATREQTREIERVLPDLLRELGARVLLDLPCGDYAWMRHVDLPVERYIGADVVPALVRAAEARFGDGRHRFVVLDITADELPAADVLLCRDALVHLSHADIARAVANVRRSAISYLLTTTFPACEENEEIVTGDWRPINLQRPPFDFPAPLRLVDERCTEGGGRFSDKSLGLWRVADLP